MTTIGERGRQRLVKGYESYIAEEHPAALDLCICNEPRWRHPTTEEARIRAFRSIPSSQAPSHLFIEPDLGDNDHGEVGPDGFTGAIQKSLVARVIFETLQRTGHITTRGIRAAYIAKDLELDGYILLRRGEDGRFRSIGLDE